VNQSIVQSVAPILLPLDLVSVANYLRTDPDEDGDALEQLIAQAAAEVERLTGRVCLASTYRLQQSDWTEIPAGPHWASPSREPRPRTLELPRTPLIAVTSVKYYDQDGTQQTLDPSRYIVCPDLEPGLIYLNADLSWPTLQVRPDAVQVIFTAGHSTTVAAVPALLKQAMLLLCRFYYGGGTPNDDTAILNDYQKAENILTGQKVGGWVL
jgi:uncharacterized phiE125 gp8 family phage protein